MALWPHMRSLNETADSCRSHVAGWSLYFPPAVILSHPRSVSRCLKMKGCGFDGSESMKLEIVIAGHPGKTKHRKQEGFN